MSEHRGPVARRQSLRIMENGAIGVAEWCIEHDIPARWLTKSQLRDGASKGLATHKQCSDAFGDTHWEAGPASLTTTTCPGSSSTSPG